jgi:hypothetical protein
MLIQIVEIPIEGIVETYEEFPIAKGLSFYISCGAVT